MAAHFSPSKFFVFYQLKRHLVMLLSISIMALLVPLTPAQADENRSESFTSRFEVLTETNLGEYVSGISQRYYEQVALLRQYFQLYQQRRDPRGFNVWHLRGFTPAFSQLNAQHQLIAANNESFLADRPEQALTSIFAELKDVSVNLMVAFRDNDPEAFKTANTTVKNHNEQINSLLAKYQREHEMQELSLD